MSQTHAGPARRILVVEDEYFIAVDLVKRFEEEGVLVVGPACTIDDALDLIDSEHFDGAVLDLNLSGEMAFPVADALRARAIPFVFATGYDRGIIPKRYADIVSFEKPVGAEKIINALFTSG